MLLPSPSEYLSTNLAVYGLLVVGIVLVLSWQSGHFRKKLDIPRLGPEPSIFGNTSKGEFYNNSVALIEEGYAKYKDSLYSLWTTNMDRVMIPAKFMDEFNRVPRHHLQLTATLRHAGKYTGMDIADEGMLGYEVCAGPLSQNIGRLCQPLFDELRYSLEKKLEGKVDANGVASVPMYFTILDLVTTSTAHMFVGPELCRDQKWLSTATNYTIDVGAVAKDLQKHYQFLHPIVAPFLKSYQLLQLHFDDARRILLPIFAQRRNTEKKANSDMIQWLVDGAKGRDMEGDRLIKRMLFLNMAAIHTTTHTVTNIILDLCDRPEYVEILRQEVIKAIEAHGGVKAPALTAMKRLDSFMKESQRLNPMDLMIFNRRLLKPVTLSTGITIPPKTFISMPIYSLCRDPERYPDPSRFDGDRFYNLRMKDDQARYQFAASDKDGPGWGFSKFACPGRFWAAAQVKLVLIVLLLEFNIGYPAGQKERPVDTFLGERRTPSRSQLLVLKRLSKSQ